MKIKTITTGIIITSIIAGVAVAHEGATGIVKQRMDAMSVMGKNIKLLVPMMQGKSNYDAQIVRDAALEIKSHSGETMTKLFPKMDMEMDMTKNVSKAKPVIWQDWDKFSDLSNQLLILTDGLAQAANNGLADKSDANNDAAGSASMMGGSSSMMGGAPKADPTLEELAKMPADSVFKLVTNSCAACHTQFRTD